jgi:hypothetical protein
MTEREAAAQANPFSEMTDEELISTLGTVRPDTPLARQLEQMVQLRGARRQADATDKLVAATDRLARVTGRLGGATWALAGLTLLLVLAAGLQVYPAFKKGETTAPVGQRVRQECGAIMDEVADYAEKIGRPITRDTFASGLLKCLIESASRGR